MKRKIHAAGILAGDVIVVVCVLLLAAVVFSFAAARAGMPAVSVEIITESAQMRYPLWEDREIPIQSAGHTLTVTVKDGTVYVSETDCPNRICAATGKISVCGQSILCAPARVLIKVVGEEGSYGENADVILP